MTEFFVVIINENMHDASAILIDGDPYPLRGWERVWSVHTDRREAEASLAEASKYIRGRMLPG